MKCDQVERLLYLYEDEELEEKEEKEVEEHIKQCPDCSKKLADLKLIRAEVREKRVPQPSETYWESFAWRVRDKIEQKGTMGLGRGLSCFLKMIFSYSPAKIKWATAVVSVVLVFVVVKLFISYEKINIATLRQKTEIGKISAPVGEIPKVETKTPQEKEGAEIPEKGGMDGQKKIHKAVAPPQEEAILIEQKEITAPPQVRDTQKKVATDLSTYSAKEEVGSTARLGSAPTVEKEKYMTVEAMRAPETPSLSQLAKEAELETGRTIAHKDSLTEEELAREVINLWREFTKEKLKREEKDKGYLKMAQGYLRLYEIAKNKDETLKEAIDSVRVYIDSTITSAYKDSINSIFLELESLHKIGW